MSTQDVGRRMDLAEKQLRPHSDLPSSSTSAGSHTYSNNMEAKERVIEEPDTCRICRGEGSEEEQLFYPCKCSGSIKYVHQACLVEWLSHSQKKYCELCKTPFHFTKLYDPHMPQALPTPLFIRQLSIRCFRTILMWLRFVLVAFVWLGWLPWSMRAIWRGLFWLADGHWSDTEISKRQALERLNQLVSNATVSVDAVMLATGSSTRTGLSSAESDASSINTISDTAEPLMLSLVKRTLSALLIPASSSSASPINSNLSDMTTGSAKSRHPSWLSDVKFLNTLTPSPTINNILIDTLEGQLITSLIVISFILIFLIREWVVQQQPMANIAEGEREAAVQLIANNRPQREVEVPEPQREPLLPLLQGEGQPLDGEMDEHVEHFPDDGEHDAQPGNSDQFDVHGVPPSLGSNDPVRLRDMYSAGSSSSLVRGVTVDDESDIGHLFGQPPNQTDSVWPGLEMFKDFWTRGNGDPEEVVRMIREEGYQEELDWVITALSRPHQQSMSTSQILDVASAIDAAEHDDAAAAVLGQSSQLIVQHDPSNIAIDAGSGQFLEPSNNTFADDLDTGSLLRASHEQEPPESDRPASEANEVHVNQEDHVPDGRPVDELPNTSGESENTQRNSATNAPPAPPKSFTQRIFDWFWTDITPTGPTEENQNRDDEHVVEDPALEAPFVPVRNNQRIANAGVAEEADADLILEGAGADANDVDVIEDGDDLEGIMELIGMQGPIFGLLQNAVFSALLISFAMAIGIWLPYLWGKIAVVLLANPIQLFFGVPMAAISVVADIALDTLIGILGYIIYWASLTFRALVSLLSSLVPLGDWVPQSKSVTSASLSLIDASSRRLGKVVSAFFVFHESDVPMFSVISHQALKVHEARILSVFGAMFAFSKFVFYDFPLCIISLASQGLTSAGNGFDVKDLLDQLMQSCSLGTSHLLSIGRKSWLNLRTSSVASADVPLDYGLAVWDTKDRVIAIIMGYALASVIGIFYLRVAGLLSGTGHGQRIEGLVAETLRQAGGVMKVILIIGIEMFLFPLYCGSLLDLALLPLFDNASIAFRMDFAASSPATSLFVHWFIGTCYMFHFALFVSMCRKIMRSGVLYFIRDPDDPTFHPVRDVLERSITTQLRKIAFSALVYGALVILCLGGVVWGLYAAFDGLLPIHMSSTAPILEFPIDLLFYNFVVPLAIRSIKPSDGFHGVFDWWFHKCARLLRLTDFFFGERRLDEEGHHVRRTWRDVLLRKQGDVEHPVLDEQQKARADEQGHDAYFVRDGKYVRAPASDQVRIPKNHLVFLEVTESNEPIDGEPDRDEGLHGRANDMFTKVYIPPSFKTRIVAFIILMWLFTAATGVGVTVIPLVIGRKMISSYFPSEVSVNDVYAISTGLCTVGAVAYAVIFCRGRSAMIIERIRPFVRSPQDACLAVGGVALQGIRLVYISFAFSVLLPFLFAMVIELYVLIPLHTYFGPGEGHVIYCMQDWALGVLYLQMAIRFILWHSTSRPAAALRAIFREGWLRPNVTLATRAFILPASLLAEIAVIMPLILGFTVELAVSQSVRGDKPSRIYRYSYPVTFALGLAVWLGYLIRRQVDIWRAHIRDDVYLIGERLHNFSDKRTRDDRVSQ